MGKFFFFNNISQSPERDQYKMTKGTVQVGGGARVTAAGRINKWCHGGGRSKMCNWDPEEEVLFFSLYQVSLWNPRSYIWLKTEGMPYSLRHIEKALRSTRQNISSPFPNVTTMAGRTATVGHVHIIKQSNKSNGDACLVKDLRHCCKNQYCHNMLWKSKFQGFGYKKASCRWSQYGYFMPTKCSSIALHFALNGFFKSIS